MHFQSIIEEQIHEHSGIPGDYLVLFGHLQALFGPKNTRAELSFLIKSGVLHVFKKQTHEKLK